MQRDVLRESSGVAQSALSPFLTNSVQTNSLHSHIQFVTLYKTPFFYTFPSPVSLHPPYYILSSPQNLPPFPRLLSSLSLPLCPLLTSISQVQVELMVFLTSLNLSQHTRTHMHTHTSCLPAQLVKIDLCVHQAVMMDKLQLTLCPREAPRLEIRLSKVSKDIHGNYGKIQGCEQREKARCHRCTQDCNMIHKSGMQLHTCLKVASRLYQTGQQSMKQGESRERHLANALKS